MNKPNLHYLFLLLMIGLLSACMGGAPIPQDHYYRLMLSSTPVESKITLPYENIGIPPAISHGLYAERPILYVNSQAPLELKQYHYHHWHDTPSRIIQEHLIEWLQNNTAKTNIVRLNRGEQTDILLQSRIVRLERKLSNRGIEVLVELEMALQKKYRPLHKQIYRQTINVNDDTMHDTVQAFGKAFVSIYTAFLKNISH